MPTRGWYRRPRVSVASSCWGRCIVCRCVAWRCRRLNALTRRSALSRSTGRRWPGCADLPQVVVSDLAHAAEHSLEVHLPFLQQVLGHFRLVPLAVGDATPDEVAEVLAQLWGGDETLIVVSSDLSHYLPYATARTVDRATVDTMLALAPTLEHEQACGATPLNGLLALARRRGLQAELLDLCNSGDTAGDRGRVVGYAALALVEPATTRAPTDDEASVPADTRGPTLLAHARSAIAERLGLAGELCTESTVPERTRRHLRHAEDRTRTARLRRLAAAASSAGRGRARQCRWQRRSTIRAFRR